MLLLLLLLLLLFSFSWGICYSRANCNYVNLVRYNLEIVHWLI